MVSLGSVGRSCIHIYHVESATLAWPGADCGGIGLQ